MGGYFRINSVRESVPTRSYSGPHFPLFGLNTEYLRIQSKCGKMRTRITPNTDTFYAVILCRVRTRKQEATIRGVLSKRFS